MAQCWLIPMSPVDITSDVITKPLQWGRLLNHCQRIFTHFYWWFAKFPTISMFPTGFFWLNILQKLPAIGNTNFSTQDSFFSTFVIQISRSRGEGNNKSLWSVCGDCALGDLQLESYLGNRRRKTRLEIGWLVQFWKEMRKMISLHCLRNRIEKRTPHRECKRVGIVSRQCLLPPFAF